MEKLNVGDVVKLKSGSPLMTVLAINERLTRNTRNISCGWFNGAYESCETMFPEFALQKIEPDLRGVPPV